VPKRDERGAHRREARADRARGRGKRPPTPLTRERIVNAALDLVDTEGLSALSMRRLGAVLGVDPMAVYYYVPNKEALLDAVVEAVMADIDLTVDDPSSPPEERALRAAEAYRDALLAHRNALPIVLARGPSTVVALRPVELLIGIMRDAGLAPGMATAAMNAIAAAVRGAVGMYANQPSPQDAEQMATAMVGSLPPDDFPNLREAWTCWNNDFEADFEFGLRALIQGLIAAGRAEQA
jgi:TetR/AcrR family tetracycline transcriptional repressor